MLKSASPLRLVLHDRTLASEMRLNLAPWPMGALACPFFVDFFCSRTFVPARNAWSGLDYTTRRVARGMSRAAKAEGAPRL